MVQRIASNSSRSQKMAEKVIIFPEIKQQQPKQVYQRTPSPFSSKGKQGQTQFAQMSRAAMLCTRRGSLIKSNSLYIRTILSGCGKNPRLRWFAGRTCAPLWASVAPSSPDNQRARPRRRAPAPSTWDVHYRVSKKFESAKFGATSSSQRKTEPHREKRVSTFSALARAACGDY